MSSPPIMNVHTPHNSFAIVHSTTQDSLNDLFNTLSRKKLYNGARVGPGWLKYEHNDSCWNLDDESDYKIWVWRLESLPAQSTDQSTPSPGSSTPTLHLHDPASPLPSDGFRNPSYYQFQTARAQSPAPKSTRPRKAQSLGGRSGKTTRQKKLTDQALDFRQEFERFHGENGVRTVIGSIGHVQNVRMLLKNGYRHVYISRKFAGANGLIPVDALPGAYGYGGLVSLGELPITLTPSTSFLEHHPPTPVPQQMIRHETMSSSYTPSLIGSSSTAHYAAQASSHPKPSHQQYGSSSSQFAPSVSGFSQTTTAKRSKKTAPATVGGTMIQVYLSEEAHFDVVLGRSFFEKRQIKTSPTDPTDVVCLDTGEKIECELVVLKDGRGEIVTVT